MAKMSFEQLCNEVSVEMLEEMVHECFCYDGSLEEYKVENFDEDFFNTYFDNEPMKVAQAVYFGKIQNWNDEYIYFNGYGNLESMNKYEYEKMLNDGKEEIIERALEMYQDNKLYLSNEIEQLFDEHLEDEE